MLAFGILLLFMVAVVRAFRVPRLYQLVRDRSNAVFPRSTYARRHNIGLHLSGAQDIMEGFAQAFVGGTVGVMSVSIIVELRKAVDKSDDFCPYCMGNGEMLCGLCCGMKMQGQDVCSCCSGRGLVMCLNCKGDGRITPLILQSKATRDPVSLNS